MRGPKFYTAPAFRGRQCSASRPAVVRHTPRRRPGTAAYHWGVAAHPARDVVVVGGGVIGLSVAWSATRAGLSVSVVDPAPGRGATWAAAGMLAPVGEANFGEEALTTLNMEAARAWPVFAADLESTTGQMVGYVTRGTLLVAADPSDMAALDDLIGYRVGLGLGADRLSARRCRASEPLLAPGVRGGADLVGDHQVDNRRLVEALAQACKVGGVDLAADEVAEVEVRDGRALGVVLRQGGRRPAGAVVVAAGCRAGSLEGIPASARPRSGRCGA